MTRRICIVTGTRAEYGLLKSLIGLVRDADDLDLHLVATGMHLSPEFGMTVKEIEADGFHVDDRVETLLSSDTEVGVGKAVGLGVISFSELFARRRPDVLVLLGDRFEILAAATSALLARIPIAHIHGGETTEGAVDEAIRHAVTKMAQLHFVAAAPYRDRVIQLGEAPERVFLVGGLGTDAIASFAPLSRTELEEDLDFRFGERSLLITFHPPTLDGGQEVEQMQALLDALAQIGPDVGLLFTMPNADAGGRKLSDMISDFVASRPNARLFASLGQRRYLSCLRQVSAVVGNSSSGLAEAPSFGIATVDIGDRQKGRLKASSVISCLPETAAILAGVHRALDDDFRASLNGTINPYGDGGASKAILATLRDVSLDMLIKKSFHDIPVSSPC